MAVIQIDTDHLQATIMALQQGRNEVKNAYQQAVQGMQALQSSPWAGQHRSQAEAAWERIAAQCTSLEETLETLISRTRRFAARIEEANHGQQFGNSMSVSEVTPLIPIPPSTPEPPPSEGLPGLPPYQPFTPGETTAPGVLQKTAGCTNYVLRRINLNDMGSWPNAHSWNDVAKQANYVIDSRPAAGAVMVFEPNVMGASQLGHVAYVERVEPQADGQVKITISEADLVYNDKGEVVWGTHTKPTTREILVRQSPDGNLTYPDGRQLNGVSFILGRHA
ncbi:CHAP domain-containing protein [Chloroflexus sp.]|uniref:CHAP domain-containing protein n=1 Tax=Chloroflexus sp. TaxID=1904827 RepID=UPI00404B2774